MSSIFKTVFSLFIFYTVDIFCAFIIYQELAEPNFSQICIQWAQQLKHSTVTYQFDILALADRVKDYAKYSIFDTFCWYI